MFGHLLTDIWKHLPFSKGRIILFYGFWLYRWKPNAARSAVAPSIWGPWTELGNPCQGKIAKPLFTRKVLISSVSGRKNVFIYIGDRWNPQMPLMGDTYGYLLIFKITDSIFIGITNGT